MTNHSEITGSFENGDISRREGSSPEREGWAAEPDEWAPEADGSDPGADGRAPDPGGRGPKPGGWAPWAGGGTRHEDDLPSYEKRSGRQEQPVYEGHGPLRSTATFGAGAGAHQVTLRTPAELADALPYLLGYRPEDSIVLVSLHDDRGGRGRFGGRARLGIPANPDDWEPGARQLAQGLVNGGARRGARPQQIVAYLCQEPAQGETAREVMERLRPLAQQLRRECGHLDVPVIEALCISGGRFWSYCCATEGCCPHEGEPMGLPGTSVLAAAAAYAGIQVRGTLRELRARLLPLETSVAEGQKAALDAAAMTIVPKILDEAGRAQISAETIDLAGRALRRFAETPPVSDTPTSDRHDDDLLTLDEAATLILGLQDRTTRDRAAEWMEGEEAAPALRLWRALARRCVGPYGEHAAAPLSLAGWVAWSSGDELEAREALAMALGADPDYLFARLLHQACNEGLDPESVRRCLRAERSGRNSPRKPLRRGRRVRSADGCDGPRAGSARQAREPKADGRRPRRPSTDVTRPPSARRGDTGPRTTRPAPMSRRGDYPGGAHPTDDDTRGTG